MAQGAAAQSGPAPGYVPQRVYDTGRGAFTDFETMIAELARADAVFVGEQHDDPNTHRLQAAMLQGLLRRRVRVTLSLEMFERDAQGSIDQYLAGGTTEEEFLKNSRPWPRYATDYRPLVELAKANGWRVIAANLPRRHASEIVKGGLAAIDRLPANERSYAALQIRCPHDAYYDRFAAEMADHPSKGAEQLSREEQLVRTERYYESQCVKDETMAESVATGTGTGPVVHFNGAFHSDFGLGSAERARRRLTDRKVAVITILPVTDLDTLAPAGDELKRADYLVYTIK